MKEVQLSTHEAEATALEGYEKMSFEEKNKTKFMVTFPYPYMNGYLHLGKLSIQQTSYISADGGISTSSF
jgi:leucyl-tRNA synthetase